MARPDLAERNRSNATHGHTRDHRPTRTWTTWNAMMGRANRNTGKDAPAYFGRGIRVCARWLSFENFLADMGERPNGMTIERKDVDGNYEPSNCRWATPREQANNRRSSRPITAFGRTQNIKEWALEFGVSHQVIHHRLNAGWLTEIAVSAPVHAHNRWHMAAKETA